MSAREGARSERKALGTMCDSERDRQPTTDERERQREDVGAVASRSGPARGSTGSGMARLTSLDVYKVILAERLARDRVLLVVVAEVLEDQILLKHLTRLDRHDRFQRLLTTDRTEQTHDASDESEG